MTKLSIYYVSGEAIRSPGSRKFTAVSTVSKKKEELLDACIYYVLAKFQSVSELKFYSKKEPADDCS